MLLPALYWLLPTTPRVPEEPGAEEPTSPEESSGLSLLHQESKRRAMLAEVLKQELPTLAESLRLEQEQVGGPPQRPLVVKPDRTPTGLPCNPSSQPASLLAQVVMPADVPSLPSQGPGLSRNHVEQLLRCLGAHIHTPNRRQLAQELRALQGQLQAQGIGPALLHGPLFTFPDAVRELSHRAAPEEVMSTLCLGMCKDYLILKDSTSSP